MTPSTLPDTIGPYRILRRVGRGGMSEVFIAADAVTHEEHALKLMLRGTAHADRFNQEYEALTRLNHPGIVRVYQYGFQGKSPWFSMEHIAGEPLQNWVRRFGKPGTPARHQEVIRSGAFLAEALGYVHERNLIHRDLKGNNVLVLPDGRIKVLDFGTAHIRDGLRQLTRPGEFIGTLAYASPEQFKGKPFDHRVDLYAMGVLLYRLVTGQRPFSADDPAALARLIVRSHPEPPSLLVDDVPPGLEDLILDLLAKRPHERPESAREVAARLEMLMDVPLGLPGWGASIRRDRLTGRETILRQLRRQLETPGGPLLLYGPAGSDRSLVAASLVADTQSAGLKTLVVKQLPGDGVMALLRGLLRAVDAAAAPSDRRVTQANEALRLLVQRGPIVALRNRPGLRAVACSVLVGLVREQGPTLILVEDAHRSDTPARELLAEVIAHVSSGGLPVRWLISAEARDARALRELRADIPGCRRVALGPLEVSEVALRVGAMLDRRPPPTALARILHSASGGQPSWIEDLVTTMVDRGAIRLIGQDGDRIEWDLDDEVDIPDSARKILLADLSRLTAPCRRILEVLAVAGAPCGATTLAAALGWSFAELRVPIADLLRDGWLRVDGERLDLARALVSRVVREQLDPARLHAAMATLQPQLDHEEPRLEHITILLAAGATDQAITRALAVAGHHLDQLRAVDAIEALDLIVDIEDTTHTPDPDLHARALLLHAKALLMVRPVDPKLARSLSGARKLAKDPALRCDIAITRARLQRTVGHLANHRAQLAAAAEAAAALNDVRLQSLVACFEADALRLEGRIRDADDRATQAVTLAMKAGPIPVAWAEATRAGTQLGQERFEQSEPMVRSALATFEQHGVQRGAWAAVPTLIAVLRQLGRYTEALRLLASHLAIARRCEEPGPTVRLLLAAATVEADLHRLGRAQEHIDEIEMLIRKGEQLDLRLAAQTARGRILLASGHVQPAMVTLREAHERAGAAGLPATAELARALGAEARAALDDPQGARDEFASAMLGLLGCGDATALLDGARARMRALATSTDPSMMGRPIRSYLQRDDLLPIRIEHLIASARHAFASQRRAAARTAALDAQALIEALQEHLDDTDRAALRLHPWSREIRRILR